MPRDLQPFQSELAGSGTEIRPRMTLRRDPELMYCLDSAVELGELTPMEALLFNYDTGAASALAEQRHRNVNFWNSYWIRNTARDYLNQVTLEERYVFALKGIPCLDIGLTAFHERMAFVVQNKALVDLGHRAEVSRLLRDHDPALAHAIPAKVFQSVSDINRSQVQAFAGPLFRDSLSRLEEDVQLARDAVQWLAMPGSQKRARSIAAALFQQLPDNEPPIRVALEHIDHQAVSQAVRKRERSAKSAIKKAIKLMTRFGAEDNARLLVSGEVVEIHHPDSPFVFRLKAHQSPGWLLARTATPGAHVPYQLELWSKSGMNLASLCVLFSNTPVLDQLLALSMYVQSGNELELLEKANWFGVREPGSVRQFLKEAAPSLVDKVWIPSNLTSQSDCGLFRLPALTAEDEFWKPYRNPVSSWLAEALQPARELLSRVQLALSTQPQGTGLLT